MTTMSAEGQAEYRYLQEISQMVSRLLWSLVQVVDRMLILAWVIAFLSPDVCLWRRR